MRDQSRSRSRRDHSRSRRDLRVQVRRGPLLLLPTPTTTSDSWGSIIAVSSWRIQGSTQQEDDQEGPGEAQVLYRPLQDNF